MTTNNNTSVLPFYGSIDEQNHRRSYAYGDIYPLFTPAGHILPFQITRPHRNSFGITHIYVYDKNGSTYGDILTEMRETGLDIVQDGENDIIIYPGLLPMTSAMQNDGMYYLLITGADVFYSEMFTIVQDVTPYLKIEWYDLHNLEFSGGKIIYEPTRFKNILYLCTELGKPDYKFDEEGESRDGIFFPTKQLSEKVYKCTILAPEYLCDVMRFIRMADHVKITDKYGREYYPDSFLITPKWQGQGNLASVDIEFETDTIVKNVAQGYILQARGDFNDDFNEDFNIE